MVTLDKGKYTTWADKQEDMPIFFRTWYLDKVCVYGKWDAIISVDKNEEINGALVYYTRKRYGRKFIIMPSLTPHLGLWLPPSTSTKEAYKNRKEASIVSDLLEALPRDAVLYRQSYHPNFNNWLPFYWKGYDQTTRYTFVINDLTKWSLKDAATNVRNKINRASAELSISTDALPELVYDQMWDIMNQKGIQLIWSKSFFTDLDEAINKHARRLILSAQDSQGQVHASCYVIIDKNRAYLMLLGSNTKLRQSGAIPFIIYHAITESSKYVNQFDFEGSNLSSLFDLFSGFGGEMVPYHSIYRTKNMFWDLVYRVKMRRDDRNR